MSNKPIAVQAGTDYDSYDFEDATSTHTSRDQSELAEPLWKPDSKLEFPSN